MAVHTCQGYTFDYAIPDVSKGALVWNKPMLEACFQLTARVELTKTPTFSCAMNWWIGLVQILRDDNMLINCESGELIVVRTFANTSGSCRDLDATLMKIRRSITLLDAIMHAACPISVKKSGKSAKEQHAESGTQRAALGLEEDQIYFNDTPTFAVDDRRQRFDAHGPPTQDSRLVGLESPSGGKAVLISGLTSFTLWLVLMKDAQTVAAGDCDVMHDGAMTIPTGPQDLSAFCPIHHWDWHIDWTSNVVGANVAPSSGAGIRVESEGPGKGGCDPLFRQQDLVGTEKMGYAVFNAWDG